MFESAGFRRRTEKGFQLEVAQTSRLDVRLDIGEVAQEIEVTGTAQLMQTENAALGTVIGSARVIELPLNGRNFSQLALLAPRANSGVFSGAAAQRGGGFSIGGTRSEQNSFQLDGISNSDQWDSTIVLSPNVDAIQEFKIEVNNYAAEYGRSAGGQINVITKSGTNEYHGSAYEFHRNNAVQARNFFQRDPNVVNSQGRFLAPKFIQNQFGGTVGGPVIRNRTFFFADYEGLRITRGQTSLQSVPSPEMKTGDFSALLGAAAGQDALGRNVQANMIFDAWSTRPAPSGTRAVRDPFPGNRIPQSRIDPIAVKVRDFWPNPNIPGSIDPATRNPRLNYADSRSSTRDNDLSGGRADHRFTEKDTVYFRYNRGANDLLSPNAFPGQETFEVSRSHLLTSNYTKVLTPTIVNELRAGIQFSDYNRASQRFLNNVQLTKELGIHGLSVERPGAPQFTVGGFAGVGDDGEAVRENRTGHLQDAISFNRGRHFFKAGFEVRYIALDAQFNGSGQRGNFQFNDRLWTGIEGFNTTGNTFAGFLLGLPSNTSRSQGDPSVFLRASEWGSFFQDDFKVTSKLTINYGVRYQLYIPPKETRDDLVNWIYDPFPAGFQQGGIYVCKDPARCAAIPNNRAPLALGLTLNDLRTELLPRGVRAGKDGVPRSLLPVEKKNVAPRIGIAYRMRPSWVMRLGYGIFYDSVPMQLLEETFNNVPRVRTDAVSLSAFQNGLPPSSAFIGFEKTDLRSLADITPNPASIRTEFRNAYVQQWNFGLQRQFGSAWVAELSYLGSKGTRLNRRQHLSPADIRADDAVIPPDVNPQLRRLFPFVILDGQLITANNHNTNNSNAFSTYHGLIGRLERRFTGGLTILNSFTWSKAITDAQPRGAADNDTNNRPQNIFNLTAEKSLAPQDHRYRFVSSFVYDLPFGKGKKLGSAVNGVMNTIIGGWQANGIVTAESGFPVAVLHAGDPFSTGIREMVRPDIVCNPNLPSGQRTVDRFFNTGCYQRPPNRFGNAARMTVTGPGLHNWDLGLYKNLAVAEAVRLQFRSEFFNAFNHTNWGIPGNLFTDSNFGKISAAREPRIIQFGLKLLF